MLCPLLALVPSPLTNKMNIPGPRLAAAGCWLELPPNLREVSHIITNRGSLVSMGRSLKPLLVNDLCKQASQSVLRPV